MLCTMRSASSRARASRSRSSACGPVEQRLGVRDLDLQKGQALADLVVQFAREPAAAFLFDLQQAGGELLQFLFGLFHGGEVAVGLALQVFGVPQADAGHQDAEQDAQAKHQQQAFRGAPSRAGEFAFAVFQHALVGGGDFAERVVQFAAARHDFALEKCDLGVIAGVEHGLRKLFPDGPEFAEALAERRYLSAVDGRAFQNAKGPFVFLFQLLQLRHQLGALFGRVLNEEIAHVIAGQPEVAAQRGERLLLFDKVAVDLQVLAGDADLNAVGFHGGQHQDGDDGAISGPQYGALTPTGSHYPHFTVRGRCENTIFPVCLIWQERFILYLNQASAASLMARGALAAACKQERELLPLGWQQWGPLTRPPFFCPLQ